MANTFLDFLSLYNEYKKKVFNYILYRISFDRDTAEDLTSEIFLKAYEHFDSFDQSRSFKTWIFTIAHNHLVNHFSSKRHTISLDDVQELSEGAEYLKRIDEQLTVARLMQLMKRLPQQQQEMLMLRYVNDLSYQEIAAILGKEEGAIRTMVSRALNALRDYASVMQFFNTREL